MVAEKISPERLVFVDECGTHTSLAPLYGYAPRGERLRLSVPRKRGKNTTVLSSMTLSGKGPSLAVEGATTALVFEAYVEQVLAPSLRKLGPEAAGEPRGVLTGPHGLLGAVGGDEHRRLFRATAPRAL
jgi:hypothetical protein